MKFDKYKQNLRKENNDIYSYTTNVARIDGNKLIQLGYRKSAVMFGKD